MVTFELFNQTENYGSLRVHEFYLFKSLYVNSKICAFSSSHEETVSFHGDPQDRNRNSSALRFLSKIVQNARALLIYFVMSIMSIINLLVTRRASGIKWKGRV